MPKHIVKKIWIIIFGLAVMGAIAVMILSSNTKSRSYYQSDNVWQTDGHGGIIPPPIYEFPAPSSRDLFINNVSNSLATFVTFELFIGACLSIVLETIYFIFNKVKQREVKLNRANLFIGLAVIFLYAVVLLYIAVSNMITWHIAYLFIGLYLLLLLAAIVWVVIAYKNRHSIHL